MEVLAHCAGTRRGCVPSGKVVGTKPVAVSRAWQEDSKSAFLMASTRGRLLVLGVDPFAEVRCTGFADGDCLWDLSLQRTGDDKLEGDVFGEVVDLFFLGGRGRGRAAPGCVLLRSFRRTAGCEQPLLCYILYVAQWRFPCSLQGHRERGFLDPRTPWADACDVSGFNNPSTCSRPDDSGGAAALVPPRTPPE